MRDITKVYEEIAEFARACQAEKVVLFGSRARGMNQEKSDIDIAVYGCFDFIEEEACYCSHSSQTLAVWLRKNVIQVFAGFFCEAKL